MTIMKKPYFITWVTHGSRISERMMEFDYVIKHRRISKGQHPIVAGDVIILDEEMEKEITAYILEIVKENQLGVLAYNICRDHVHMVILCEENKLSETIRKLKGKSTHLYKQKHNIANEFHLWAQKFNASVIEGKQGVVQPLLFKAIEYVVYNRQKHNLKEIKEIQKLVENMVVSIKDKNWID